MSCSSFDPPPLNWLKPGSGRSTMSPVLVISPSQGTVRALPQWSASQSVPVPGPTLFFALPSSWIWATCWLARQSALARSQTSIRADACLDAHANPLCYFCRSYSFLSVGECFPAVSKFPLLRKRLSSLADLRAALHTTACCQPSSVYAPPCHTWPEESLRRSAASRLIF